MITGERGVGKSVVCARLAALLRDKGVDIRGVVTERLISGEGRAAVDLQTSERRFFGRQEQGDISSKPVAGAIADICPSGVADPRASGVADPPTPRWRYDDDVFRWGNEVFERARGGAVLVVDELGPVEILGRRGWTCPLERLAAGEFDTAVVVCRPGLLEEFAVVLGRKPDAVFEVSVDTRDDLPEVIAEAVRR